MTQGHSTWKKSCMIYVPHYYNAETNKTI